MYLIPKSFLSLNSEAKNSIHIILELGELLPPILQILAHYLQVNGVKMEFLKVKHILTSNT